VHAQSDHIEDDSSSGVHAAPDEAPRRVHVAWVAADATLRRLGWSLQSAAVGLIDEPFDLTLLCPPETEAHGLPSPPMSVVSYRRPRLGLFASRWAESLAARLRSAGVEVFHALDVEAAALTRKLARLMDRPYLVSSYATGDGRRLGTLDSLAAGVLAASAPIREELLVHHVAPVEKVHLVRPGVYTAKGATCFRNADLCASIVAGGLSTRRAGQTVLKSFAELTKREHECVFFLIGSFHHEKTLRADADALHLRQQLTFVDSLPAWQLRDVFREADVYVSPAPGRWMDTNSLLAMAAGVPVVAAPNSAADFLVDEQTCLLFKPNRSADLTSKLASIISDPEAARRTATAALEHLRENHSPAQMVSLLADIYRRAAEGKPL